MNLPSWVDTALIVVAFIFGVAWVFTRANDPMKVFWRCLDDARSGDFEKSFMDRINSISVYGDLLETTVRKWGVEGVTNAFHEAQADHSREF
jgi:hypothetical protein